MTLTRLGPLFAEAHLVAVVVGMAWCAHINEDKYELPGRRLVFCGKHDKATRRSFMQEAFRGKVILVLVGEGYFLICYLSFNFIEPSQYYESSKRNLLKFFFNNL